MLSMQPLTVRVIYIVPIDADPWPDARRRATEALEDLQHFFADEMGRHRYGPKTFAIAYDNDGQVLFEPIVRPFSTFSVSQFQAAPRKTCRQVLGGGRPPDAPDIEICFFEAYSIVNGVVSCPGVETTHRRCYLNALLLKTSIREWLDDDGGYGGRIFPWISSVPMQEGTLSWSGRGPSLGDVAGGSFGVIAHEMDHAFGGKHHPSNDDERQRKGHLMGKGSRGFRGYFRPDLTDNRCVLSAVDARALDQSEFFDVRELKPKGKQFVSTE